MSNRTERAAATHSILESFRYEIRRFLNFSERAAREEGVREHGWLRTIWGNSSRRAAVKPDSTEP
jgi:hypothetical protein